jgi:nitrogen fixation protein FixH
MRLQDGMRALPKRSAWRFFPWWIAGAMAVVIAVNGGMIYAALHSFPGQAGSDGFDLSNHYNSVLERVQEQAALGWTVRVDADAAGRPMVVLTGKQGEPLTGAGIQAVAERPLGAEDTTRLTFHEAAPGRYAADAPLAVAGQWDVLLTATVQGHEVTTTRRIVVK